MAGVMTRRYTQKRSSLSLLVGCMLLLGLIPLSSDAGVPAVTDPVVTDVTTRSFSVVWLASEPSTASLQVFDDAEGTAFTSAAVITPHPVMSGDEAIRTAVEDMGVMKVQVTGLQPDTDYYFRTVTTSKSTAGTTTTPEVPEFVMTAKQKVRTKIHRAAGARAVPESGLERLSRGQQLGNRNSVDADRWGQRTGRDHRDGVQSRNRHHRSGCHDYELNWPM